jgi:hypothetical protein
MRVHARIFALASVVVLVPTALAASTPTVAGSWRKLPAAPSAVLPGTSVWTGKQLIVVGNVPNKPEIVAAAYHPAATAWRSLVPPSGSLTEPGYKSVWTGKEMLVWGAFHSVAYRPATKHWRSLRSSIPLGIVVWTGREAIGWGGGCCGDANVNGTAYNPTQSTFRRLARSPLAPSQRPIGAWTGRELIVFVSSFGPDGKRWPSRLARAAAYDPTSDTWRRIAPLPSTSFRFGGSAVWDGHQILVVAAGGTSRSAFAYNPRSNRWRRLSSLPVGRVGASAVWTGKQLYLWGGQTADASRALRDGLAYEPGTDRWSGLPQAPFRARNDSMVAWTGRSLIVWGGVIGTPPGTNVGPTFPRDGASFTPAP